MSTETLLRHWKTLQLVPRYPRKATAHEICRQLAGHNYNTSERTVQRDLDKLSSAFPLVCDTRNKPYGWSWDREARLLDVPGMDLSTALTFHFVHEYVEPLLPASVRTNLAPHVGAATRVLDACTDNPLPSWPDKVVVIPQGQALESPMIDPGIMDTVYEAVLRDRQLSLAYQPRSGDGETRDYLVHPLGLVLRNRVCYLVATLFDYTDVVQLALHRAAAADMLDTPARKPAGFSLRQYVADGSFAYPVGAPIELAVRFDRATAYHLAESPLSADQVIEDIDDTEVRVTATVLDTQQLRWWLLAFGDQVVVEGPAALRDEFARIAARLAARYADSG